MSQLISFIGEKISSFEGFKQAYLEKKEADRPNQEKPWATIRIFTEELDVGEKGAPHITLYFPKECEIQFLYEMMQKLANSDLSGQYVSNENTDRVFKNDTRAGRFLGPIKETHKRLWLEFFQKGWIVPEMPASEQTDEMEGYFFNAHITGFAGNIERKLAGSRVEIKFTGRSDPFVYFTI